MSNSICIHKYPARFFLILINGSVAHVNKSKYYYARALERHHFLLHLIRKFFWYLSIDYSGQRYVQYSPYSADSIKILTNNLLVFIYPREVPVNCFFFKVVKSNSILTSIYCDIMQVLNLVNSHYYCKSLTSFYPLHICL